MSVCDSTELFFTILYNNTEYPHLVFCSYHVTYTCKTNRFLITVAGVTEVFLYTLPRAKYMKLACMRNSLKAAVSVLPKFEGNVTNYMRVYFS